MLTGIGLATGFAIISGIPRTTEKYAEARIAGHKIPGWRTYTPQWLLNVIDGTLAVDIDDSEETQLQASASSA